MEGRKPKYFGKFEEKKSQALPNISGLNLITKNGKNEIKYPQNTFFKSCNFVKKGAKNETFLKSSKKKNVCVKSIDFVIKIKH